MVPRNVIFLVTPDRDIEFESHEKPFKVQVPFMGTVELKGKILADFVREVLNPTRSTKGTFNLPKVPRGAHLERLKQARDIVCVLASSHSSFGKFYRTLDASLTEVINAKTRRLGQYKAAAANADNVVINQPSSKSSELSIRSLLDPEYDSLTPSELTSLIEEAYTDNEQLKAKALVLLPMVISGKLPLSKEILNELFLDIEGSLLIRNVLNKDATDTVAHYLIPSKSKSP